jgi:hypothetical protein
VVEEEHGRVRAINPMALSRVLEAHRVQPYSLLRAVMPMPLERPWIGAYCS